MEEPIEIFQGGKLVARVDRRDEAIKLFSKLRHRLKSGGSLFEARGYAAWSLDELNLLRPYIKRAKVPKAELLKLQSLLPRHDNFAILSKLTKLRRAATEARNRGGASPGMLGEAPVPKWDC